MGTQILEEERGNPRMQRQTEECGTRKSTGMRAHPCSYVLVSVTDLDLGGQHIERLSGYRKQKILFDA